MIVQRKASLRSFTLTELLVAMGIIAIIAGLTMVGVRSVARDARLASAVNTVAAALDTARGIAIRDNKLTAVVFRPRLEGHNRQYIEIVVVQWTGESPVITVNFSQDSVEKSTQVIDRYRPVPGVNTRRLSTGIKVAGPIVEMNLERWRTQSHFPAMRNFPLTSADEAPGSLLGVIFAGNGTVVTRNAVSDAQRFYVDFNGDGRIQTLPPPAPGVELLPTGDWPPTQDDYNALWLHDFPEKEPTVTIAPFLAVFDDDRARARYDTSAWVDPNVREIEYSEYISQFADRIHFNRYTGVVMR